MKGDCCCDSCCCDDRVVTHFCCNTACNVCTIALRTVAWILMGAAMAAAFGIAPGRRCTIAVAVL